MGGCAWFSANTMSFHIRDRSIWGFHYLQESWTSPPWASGDSCIYTNSNAKKWRSIGYDYNGEKKKGRMATTHQHWVQEIKRKLKLRDVRSAQLPQLRKSHAKDRQGVVGLRFLIIENFLKKLSFCKYLKQNSIKVQNLLRRTKRGVSSSLFLYFTSNFHSKGFKTPCVTPRTLNSLKLQLSHYQVWST